MITSDILLLYNHKSGQQKPKHALDQIIKVFAEAGVHTRVRSLNFKSNPLVEMEGVGCVVAAGGDGTIGYVVDNMLRQGIDIPLGIIPIGTANDFATMLGIPHDPRKAALHILHSDIRLVDCGWVNGQHFVNVFSFGLFATTSQHTDDSRKRRFGRLAYIAEGAHELTSLQPLPLTIQTEREEFSAEVYTALVFNGCTAGSFKLARNARPDDGLFDGVFLLKRPIWRLAFDLLHYLCGGKPSSIIRISGENIRITSSMEPIPTDIDGQAGPSLPVDIRCLHHALKIRG